MLKSNRLLLKSVSNLVKRRQIKNRVDRSMMTLLSTESVFVKIVKLGKSLSQLKLISDEILKCVSSYATK